jgi:ornithine--oxo-acid transaminase
MTRSILELLEERAGQNFSLHEQFLNTQMVRALKTIGFDRRYVRASGPYLYDDRGDQYLDLLSGCARRSTARRSPRTTSPWRRASRRWT